MFGVQTRRGSGVSAAPYCTVLLPTPLVLQCQEFQKFISCCCCRLFKRRTRWTFSSTTPRASGIRAETEFVCTYALLPALALGRTRHQRPPASRSNVGAARQVGPRAGATAVASPLLVGLATLALPPRPPADLSSPAERAYRDLALSGSLGSLHSPWRQLSRPLSHSHSVGLSRAGSLPKA